MTLPGDTERPDPQRVKVYAFQERILRRFWGGILDPHGVVSYVEELKSCYLPDEKLEVAFQPREWFHEDVPEMRAWKPLALFVPTWSPPTLLFYFGKKLGWIKRLVLHEFAHAVVHFTYGDEVEPHGPEYLGVFCHLMSEAFRFHPLLFVHMADDLGLRVLSYDPPPKARARAQRGADPRRAAR